jgi:hypothetical protein
VPQAFLSSRYNAHDNINKTAHNSAVAKNRVSQTLSRVFWQQKYFLENLVLARSPLATANFSEPFCESDSQNDSAQLKVFAIGTTAPRARRRAENEKRDDRTTHGNDTERGPASSH